MKLIAGLGNPGREYAGTRHNAGYMVVEALMRRHGITGGKSAFHSLMTEGPIAGQKCLLQRPVTYMNRSGPAIREALDFFKLAPADLMVVVDDTALPCGTIRLRAEGSAGGHNGLKDVERALGTQAYPRLRIGIDAPPANVPLHDYVLGRFTPAQWPVIERAIEQAADAAECWIERGIDAAMTRYNASPA